MKMHDRLLPSIALLVALTGCQLETPVAPPAVPATPPSAPGAETPAVPAAAGDPSTLEQPATKPLAEDKGWISLFDGRSLEGWKSTEFGGEGEVNVEDGAIVMEIGQDMTGVTLARKDPLPKNNYELSLDAARLDGNDFFCGLTFPVNDSHCSFIIGGWGGGVVGLSSINGFDASENETTKYMEFKTGQWYKVRVRVSENRIQTWIDDKEIVDADIEGRKVGIRGEMELSKPMGVATWNTKGALKNIRLRKLEPEAAVEKKAD
jgi:3-keto-disaccharide hydrolase